MKLSEAKSIAVRVVDALKPYCSEVVIAGSIRREKPVVKDIEVVCAPWRLGRAEFGCELVEVDGQTVPFVPLSNALRIIGAGTDRVHVKKNGQRYKQIVLNVGKPDQINLDLFIVYPPAQFGAILAIRTGSVDFSRHMMIVAQKLGITQKDGYLAMGGERIDTPTEEDYFRAIGLKWIEPKYRK